MRPAVLSLIAVLAAACGHRIGDSCNMSSDCAQDGSRVCDTYSPGGSCTIQGCDYDTCPSEAVCVRFYPALDSARTCESEEDCGSNEVCTVGGECAPRSIEQRFCMLECGDNGDCRTGYECRGRDLQVEHGGEPVPDPLTGQVPGTKFCGPRRPCTTNASCPEDQFCDSEGFCANS